MDYRSEAPECLKSFLTYIETIKGKSSKTANEYYLDLRLFFRYLLWEKSTEKKNIDIEDINICSIGLDFVRGITINDIYSFMIYLNRDRLKYKDRPEYGNGLTAAARARKVSSIRSFFRYLTEKAHELDENPAISLNSPKIKKSLPKHLSFGESAELLSIVDGQYKERDYCILTLFLNCGLRVSELVGLSVGDVRDDSMIVTGKGNKERVVYLNHACIDAISAYLPVRPSSAALDRNAMFISRQNRRISVKTVQWLVKKYIALAGLDPNRYSVHKLRHTAATLMYQNGVDVRTLQEVLGHESLDTTRIYTHVDNSQMRQAVAANPLSNLKAPRRTVFRPENSTTKKDEG